MERKLVSPRWDYKDKIEALGFDFHGDYWREEAYYRFTAEEVERLEKATAEAYRMYCEAAGHIIERNPEWMERFLGLPFEVTVCLAFWNSMPIRLHRCWKHR